MSTFAILAPGPSLAAAVADQARPARVIAVSDAVRLVPWAEALVAQDREWWEATRAAHWFHRRKFSTNSIDGVERVERHDLPEVGTVVSSLTNSGAFAIYVSVQRLGARRVMLYGFDMRGFGRHAPPLSNPGPGQVEIFQRQFERIARWCTLIGVTVENRTPGSALRAFPPNAMAAAG